MLQVYRFHQLMISVKILESYRGWPHLQKPQTILCSSHIFVFPKVAVLCHALHVASLKDQAAKPSAKLLSFLSLLRYTVICIDSSFCQCKYLHFLTEMYTVFKIVSVKANVTNFSVALSRQQFGVKTYRCEIYVITIKSGCHLTY